MSLFFILVRYEFCITLLTRNKLYLNLVLNLSFLLHSDVSLLTSFFILCYSQCLTESTVGNVSTFSYSENINCSELVFFSQDDTYGNIYVFAEDTTFYGEELIIDLLDYPCEVSTGRCFFEYGLDDFSTPNLQIMRIKPKNIEQLTIDADKFNDNTHIYIGCEELSPRIYLYVYSISFTLFIEGNNNSNTLGYFTDNSINLHGYPYVFIGSSSPITFKTKFSFYKDYADYNYFKSLSGCFYMLVSSNASVTFYYFHDTNTDLFYKNSFNTTSVCSRKNTDRYVLFHEDHTPYTNCSCWTKYNETKMDQATLFNYPDCNYNSSMFDLILPSFSTTYSLSDDLLEWYSIKFTKSSQSIEINEGKTLTIDELNLNQDDISFNQNVYVKDLTILTPGASFNTLNFDNIDYSTIDCGVELFKIHSTSTNLSSFDLVINYITGGISTSACEENSENSSATNYFTTLLSIFSIILIMI